MKSSIFCVLVAAVGMGGCADATEVAPDTMGREELALIEGGYERVDLTGVERLEGITAAELEGARVYATHDGEGVVDEGAVQNEVPTCSTFKHVVWTQVAVLHSAISCAGVLCQPIKYWFTESVSALTACHGNCAVFSYLAVGTGSHAGHLTTLSALDPNDAPEISTEEPCPP